MNPQAIRIGLVGPLPPPSGGMANQTLQLARLLREEGMMVTTIQVNKPYRPAWMGKLKGVRAIARLLPYFVELWRAAGKVDLFHVMANSGWSWHLFAAPVIWIGWLRGTPVVINYRGGEAETFFAKSFRQVAPSLSRASAVIVPSGFLQAVFRKFGVAAEIVPNIIDTRRFNNGSGDRPVRDPQAPVILVARNLEPIYDNATAIRAFGIVSQRFPKARLIIAGTGPERAMLESLAREIGVEAGVTFTGRVDNARMSELYQQASVMVNPSLVDNMPNSVLEALASETPVVSTNVGGVPYLVQHDQTALLVPPKNPGDMADAVLALLNNPDKARQLQAEGLRCAMQYTWPLVRPRLFAIYADAMQGRIEPIMEQK